MTPAERMRKRLPCRFSSTSGSVGWAVSSHRPWTNLVSGFLGDRDNDGHRDLRGAILIRLPSPADKHALWMDIDRGRHRVGSPPSVEDVRNRKFDTVITRHLWEDWISDDVVKCRMTAGKACREFIKLPAQEQNWRDFAKTHPRIKGLNSKSRGYSPSDTPANIKNLSPK